MSNNKRLISSILEIVIGAALIVGVKAAGGDSVWLGMGGALFGVGIVYLVQALRYRTDDSFREKVDIEAGDERNNFIRLRAWAWAGTGFVILGGVLTVVFLILGRQEISTLIGCGVSLMVLFYWLSFLILRKKY